MKYNMIYSSLNEQYEKPLDIDEWVSSNVIGYKPNINYDLDCISGTIIRIKTEDDELPYLIMSTNKLEIVNGHNLKSFKNFPNHAYDLPLIDFVFTQTNKLDFRQLHKTVDEINNLELVNIDNFNPQDLRGTKITKLLFNVTQSKHIFDIQNYKNLNIFEVSLLESSIPGFKNLSVFFEGDLLIDSFNIKYDGILSNSDTSKYKKLQEILFKYFNGKSNSYRVDYSMDATLELIENDFEDEL